jgi:hypothetical protein
LPDFPKQFARPTPTCIPTPLELGTNTYGSRVWPTAGKAILAPFWVDEPSVVTGLQFVTGNTNPTDQYDMAVYDLQGNRIVSAGLTSIVTGSAQVADVTDTPIRPGAYLMALMLAGVTGNVILSNQVAPFLAFMGALEITGAGGGLPNPATLAALSSAAMPLMAVNFGGVF